MVVIFHFLQVVTTSSLIPFVAPPYAGRQAVYLYETSVKVVAELELVTIWIGDSGNQLTRAL